MDDEPFFSQDELKPPQHERWAPLGAAASPDPVIFTEPQRIGGSEEKIEVLEKEKQDLQQSLFSLTSRFAQIQFRLQQIIEADPQDKPKLLEELDALANQGCIDSSVVYRVNEPADDEKITEEKHLENHEEIIRELKNQLDDLENYAFKHGSGDVPQSVMLQKQQVVLDQLISKLNLNVNRTELAQSSIDDLKGRVNDAVDEIINPAKIKEKLVDHLQTQIQDLERFVKFLQIEVESEGALPKSSGSVPGNMDDDVRREQKSQNLALLRRALSILQVFAITQLGCGTKSMQAETIEETRKLGTDHLLKDLKKAVSAVKGCITATNNSDSDDCAFDSVSTRELYYAELEENEKAAVLAVDSELTQVVRKQLCPAIISLLAHGLVVDATISTSTSLVTPISCLLPKKLNGSLATTPLHPWELFIEYYEAKKGADLARAPSRMLTRSFDLEPLVSSGGVHRISIKHSLLEAIHMVLNEHSPLKRSYDLMLKALICLGLNSGRLVLWIRLIMKTSWLIVNHYTDFSYVAQTGFEGALTILGRLDSCVFNLPVDLAVRPFKNIRDAF
uniref:RUN domain-containing protein 1-like n=1 Tax=Styela clava TaxID=7725 RepID=UPI00193A7DBF|nr:RUN domain-containing protein 1-like [Styela clava]